MVLIGLLILGTGFLLFSQTRNLWMFYVAYIVMALGQGLGGWVPLMTLLNHWFARRLATAVGWANVGSRLGALLLVPAIAWAIDPNHDRLGWQATALFLGVFTLVVALPISRLIRNRPQDYNLMPDGEPLVSPTVTAVLQGADPPQRGEAERIDTDLTPAQALRTSAFWLISFGHGFTSMVILAIMAHWDC